MLTLTAAMLILAVKAQTPSKTDVFVSGSEGYQYFRIPAIIATNNGTILAFAEARKDGRSDTGNIDLVMKKSVDEGKTWGQLQVIWDDKENVCGNPVPVIDKESGKIILVACWNNGKDSEKDLIAGTSSAMRKVFVLSSNDNGTTWSTPRNITASVKKENWTWYATGPCHGIQLQNKKDKGRIVIPANHIATPNNAYYSHCIYSDDKGETWHIGGTAKEGNEASIVELKNGDLLLNMRNHDRKSGKSRTVVISNDGGNNFQTPHLQKELIEPYCQGSILNYTSNQRLTKTLLFSNPACEKKRVNMSISISHNNGKSWKKKLAIYEGRSAYSDILVLPSGNIGILYENGQNELYERISFETFPAKLFR
ncbi:MAG: exo-alpha-sialidase [Bacteroidetes bacterium]|nr:exo-alpha-sialidase [Bacteroidota bacterium]